MLKNIFDYPFDYKKLQTTATGLDVTVIALTFSKSLIVISEKMTLVFFLLLSVLCIQILTESDNNAMMETYLSFSKEGGEGLDFLINSR